MTTPALPAATMFNSQAMFDMLKFKMISDIGLNGISSGSSLAVLFLLLLGLLLYEHYRVIWTYCRNWYYNLGKQKITDYKYFLRIESNTCWDRYMNLEYNLLKQTAYNKLHCATIGSTFTDHHNKVEPKPNFDSYVRFMTYSVEMQQPFSLPVKKLGFGKWIYYFIDAKNEYIACDTRFSDLAEYMKELSAKHHQTYAARVTVIRENGATVYANTHKCFDNVFFEQKKQILKIVDTFMDSEHYKRLGLPHHLGLLLKGRPGTGKTSFIKSLAKYTSKNIYTVDMSKVTTKSRFREIIETYSERNIIVFEDFDRLKCIVDMMAAKEIERNNGDNKSDIRDNMNNGATKHELLDKLYMTYVKATTDETREHALSAYKKELEKTKGEELDLPFILNTLDGVTEQRYRILIFTCNNPEVLSSAFLRPGRIDVILEFKRANRDIIRQILVHYYELDSIQAGKLNLKGVPEYKYTPADIICICKKHDGPNPVIKCLKEGLVDTTSNVL